MRKLLLIIASCIVILSNSSIVVAQQENGEATVNQENGVFGERIREYAEQSGEVPGTTEKTIANMLISPMNWIIHTFGMQDVTILVFGKNPVEARYIGVYEPGSKLQCAAMAWAANNLFSTNWEGYFLDIWTCLQGKQTGERIDDFMQGDCAGKVNCHEGRVLGVFGQGMVKAMDSLYGTFERFLPFPMVLALLVIALMFLMQGMTASGRSQAKDYMYAFVVGLLALRFGYYLWSFVAYIVQTFTELIWVAIQEFGVTPNLFLNMVWGNGIEGYENLVSMRGITVALIVVAATLMTFMLNYQYALRSIMLMVLVVLFPITCFLSVFPRYRHALQTWWEEFISNMILPMAHSLALGLFFLLLRYSDEGLSVWIIIAYFFALPTVYGLVRRLVGAQDSGGGLGSSMAGFAGLMSIGAIARMLRPTNLKGLVGNAGIGSVSSAGGSTADTTPSGSTGHVGGGVSLGSNTMRGIPTAGRIAGFGLKAAGALGGFAFGTMAGNPAAGIMVGGALGGSVAKRAEQGMNMIPGLAMKVKGAGVKAKEAVTSAHDYVNTSIVNGVRAPVKSEPVIGQATPAQEDAHFHPDYKPAGARFWQSIQLDHIQDRSQIVDLQNRRQLDRFNDVEQAFLHQDQRYKNRDYYV